MPYAYIDSLRRIKNSCQEYDWDSYGSGPLPDELISKAHNLITYIQDNKLPIPIAVPVPTGEIMLEWYALGTSFSIDIGIDDITYYKFDGDVMIDHGFTTIILSDAIFKYIRDFSDVQSDT